METSLPDRYRPLAVDLRGFGDTDPEPVDATRGLGDHADDLAALIETLGLAPVHVVGWSMGGGVVLQYLSERRRGHRAASVTLVAPVSPFGFGGTRGTEGTLCDPSGAGCGGGAANADFVARLAAGDRGADSATSPRQVLLAQYVKPPFVPAELDIKPGDDGAYPAIGWLSSTSSEPHSSPENLAHADWRVMPSASPMRAHVAPSSRPRPTHPARSCSTRSDNLATRGRWSSTASRSVIRCHGASRGTADAAGFDSMICWHSATHSSQMYTPAPATRVATSVSGLPQNEHQATACPACTGSVAGVVGTVRPPSCKSQTDTCQAETYTAGAAAPSDTKAVSCRLYICNLQPTGSTEGGSVRHLYGIALACAMALAAFFGGGWGYDRLLRLPASPGSVAALPAGGGSLLSNSSATLSLAALAATGLLAGLLIAVPQISPLAAGLPGLFFLGWTALYLTNVQHAIDLIPLQSRAFGAGWEAMLFNGILGAAGLAMIVPLFIPSRWRRARAESAETVAGEAGDFLADLQASEETQDVPLPVGAPPGRRVAGPGSTRGGDVPPTRATRIVTGRAIRTNAPRMPRRGNPPSGS